LNVRLPVLGVPATLSQELEAHSTCKHKQQVVVVVGRVTLVAQRPIVIKLSRGRSVGPYVRTYVHVCGYISLSSALWKNADWIWMPFGIIGRTGAGMRQVVGFVDRSTGRGIFEGKFGARHCNQWGLYGVRVRKRRDVALFPNYFGQTC